MKIRRKAKRLRKKVVPRRAPNPLRVDPTRTATLRRTFAAKVKAAFKRLRWEVRRLVVEEDALGLREVSHDPWELVDFDVAVGDDPLPLFSRNAFCPTGEGGGVDPSCSPGGKGGVNKFDEDDWTGQTTIADRAVKEMSSSVSHSAIKDKSGKPLVVFHGTDKEFSEFRDGPTYFSPDPRYGFVSQSDHVYATLLDIRNPYKTDLQAVVERAAYDEEFIKELKDAGHDGIVYSKSGDITKGATGWGNDYPQYIAFSKDQVKRIGKYTKEDYQWRVERGDFTVNILLPPRNPTGNARWSHAPNPEKVRLFQEWLRQQVLRHVVSQKDADLWRAYVNEGYRRGAGRAYDDTKARMRESGRDDRGAVSDFYRGTKDQFLRSSFAQPVSVEKAKLLAGRAFDDLEGVTADMSLRMSRALTDGLVAGLSPRDVADDLEEEVGLGEARALTVARTELIRAHAEGQLQALDDLGVEEVGVMVEWVVTPDEKLCPKCAALEGVVLKLEEAQGLIPQHPNCRCTWVPANVGEPSKGQKRSKGEIEDAFEEADMGDEEVSSRRPEAMFNAFCPTGEGGGIDPTCSPGGRVDSGKINALTPRQRKLLEKVEDETRKAVAEFHRTREESERVFGGKLNPPTRVSTAVFRSLRSDDVKALVEAGLVREHPSGDLVRINVPPGYFDPPSILSPQDPTGNAVERFSEAWNVFCATGEGGGVDPSCSPGGKSSIGTTGKLPNRPDVTFSVREKRSGLKQEVDSIVVALYKKGAKGYASEEHQLASQASTPEAHDESDMVAFVGVRPNKDGTYYVAQVHTDESHRRQGLATAMYDVLAERGIKLSKSPLQTDLGDKFRAAYDRQRGRTDEVS